MQTSESSTTRNQKNENSENSRARNESYFHWLKTGDDNIFVVRFLNYSRPTGSVFTKSEISAKSAKPSFQAEGFEAFEICRFSERCPKGIRFRCLQSLRKTEEAEKCTKRIHPKTSFIYCSSGCIWCALYQIEILHLTFETLLTIRKPLNISYQSDLCQSKMAIFGNSLAKK